MNTNKSPVSIVSDAGAERGLAQHTPPPSATVPSRAASRPFPRSCLSCNSKKIRCDRKQPCAPCTRAGRTCEFPPSGPRVRRPRKTIIADMSSRLADLEKTLIKTRELSETPLSSPSRSQHAVTSGHSKNATYSVPLTTNGSRADMVVQKGSASEYFNEIFISRAINEDRCIESVLTPAHSPSVSSKPSPINAMGILSAPVISTPPASFHPPKDQAVKLWNRFTEPVQACATLRLLHVPTDEIKVFSAINDPSTAALDDIALCFAIYFAATVSMDAAEVERSLHQPRETALLRFKTGLEQAFAHGDFLDHPSMTALHALAVYAASLRTYSRGKGLWILNGLAIRIAQSLGLHRDGSRLLGLSPFQAEIRRRLWWHLLCRDARSGEDYGIENTSGTLLVADVELPANVNDTDLDPDMEAPPRPRASWTPMTLSLANIDLGRTMQSLAALAAAASPTAPPSEAERLQMLREAQVRADKWLAMCNPVVPQQRLTRNCIIMLLHKFSFVTKLQWILLRQRAGSREEFATDENLEEALVILDMKMNGDNGDGLLSQFEWTQRLYPQYNVTMYVLLHLCVKPEAPAVQCAWDAVNSFFAGEVELGGDNVSYGPKLSVLAALREKAVAVREKMQLVGKPSAEIVTKEEDDEPAVESGERLAEGGSPPEQPEGNIGGLHFDMDAIMEEDWPSWETLVQDFQLDTADVFLQF